MAKGDEPVAKVESTYDVDAPCGDGTLSCSNPKYPICCMNGSALQFCCDIAHPVCTPSNPQGSRCLSQFEEAMLGSMGPAAEEEPMAKGDEPVAKVESTYDVDAPCGDGTLSCSNPQYPICCMNGSALQYCCDIAHPVCKPSNPKSSRCLSQFEEAMLDKTVPRDVCTPSASQIWSITSHEKKSYSST
jgi:hypothetical protein